MAELKSTGWVKYAAADRTVDDGAPTEVSATAPSTFMDCRGYRSARVRYYNDAAARAMTDVTVFLGYWSTNAGATGPAGGSVNQYHTKQLCKTTTMVAGTKAGVAGGNATDGEFYVDDMGTLTTTTWGQKLMNYVNGTIQVYEENNQIAELLISDLANADYIHLEFDVGDATLSNAEVHLDV